MSDQINENYSEKMQISQNDQQQEEKETNNIIIIEDAPKKSLATNNDSQTSSNHKNFNIGTLVEYLRKLNEYLDEEEEYDRINRKIRCIIFKQDLISNRILYIYKYLLNRINQDSQKNIFLTNPSHLLENHRELISNLKLIKTFNELLKFLVDLSSPMECFYINHNLIFIILNRFELILKHNSAHLDLPDFLNEIPNIQDQEENLSDLIDFNIQKFKDDLIKFELFKDMGISFLNLIDYYKSMSNTFQANKNNTNINHTFLKHFKLLKNIIFDSLILNLTLVRNLAIEKNETKLTIIINQLFDAKYDECLLKMSNLSALNKSFGDNKKYDQRAFVCYSLLVQIMSLLFSRINCSNLKDDLPLSSSSSSNYLNLNLDDLKFQIKLSRLNLNKLAKGLCKSGAFACIVEQMLRLLTKPVDLYVFFDLSYFLWFLKFLIQNYVLKQLKEADSSNSTNTNTNTQKTCSKETNTQNSTTTNTNESYNFDYFKNRLSKKSIIEKSFLNDLKSEASQKTKKALLNYDLFSYIVFLILENFEQLIFDSNVKNMNLLRLFHLKELCCLETTDINNQTQNLHLPPPKVTNINSLKLLCLSMNCLYELVDCINHHLEFLSSDKLNIISNLTLSDLKNNTEEDYLLFLNEFLNFDELKQVFPLLMRFYCYNQHVYSNSLIKSLFLTNQLFLNTFKHVHELIRQIKLKEQEKEIFDINSDTNATKNSSTISNLTIKPLNLTEIYNLYANTDTSFILKHVLSQFVHNEPTLNRCVIDLLDTLMCESDKHEYLFHMNFALALANIATLDNYRLLDQRTKDLVSNMLCGIRRLCKRRPNFANKILFDIHTENKINDNLGEDDFLKSKGRKRMKLDTSESDPFMDSDSFSQSKYSTNSSSWSSLKSTTSLSPSSSNSPESAKNKFKQNTSDGGFGDNEHNKNFDHHTELTKELKLLIENEFLFCIRSLDVFNKTNYSRKFDPAKMCNFIIKNDHLYRIFNYLVELFESSTNDLKLNSWQIYNCLLNMKFGMNDKINYLNELNTCYLTGSKFSLGINLGFGPFKNDFFKSNECISLRHACSTEEFRKQLRESYIKYLVEKLCLKSKRTKNAIFWVLNILKGIKLYLSKKSINLNKNTNELNQINLASHQFPNPTNYSTGIIGPNSSMLLITSSSSKFQMKLISYYQVYNLGIPFIPYTYELQQVFHSVDFSHLLDILGIVRTNRGFPFIQPDWLDNNKNKLNECLSVMEKCLCI